MKIAFLWEWAQGVWLFVTHFNALSRTSTPEKKLHNYVDKLIHLVEVNQLPSSPHQCWHNEPIVKVAIVTDMKSVLQIPSP